MVQLLDAQGITQIVERLGLLRVQLDCALVMLDSLVDLLVEIERISQVVMDIRQVVILPQRKLVEFDRFFGLLGVVVSVAKTDQSLEFFIVILKCLLVVLDSALCPACLEQQIAHRDQCQRESFIDFKGPFQNIC